MKDNLRNGLTSVEHAVEYIAENIGAAYEMEIVPRFADGRIEYRATLRDEYGEAVDAVSESMSDVIVELGNNFHDWLDEQSDANMGID